MRTLTIANYALVATLWLAILAFYLRYRRIAKAEDRLVATLLSILALDALKSFVENAFFGIVWTRNYGLGFEYLGEVLSRPAWLIVPKLLNTFVAVTIVAVVIKHWIPTELKNRRARDEERTNLLGALSASLTEVEQKEERWQLAVQATTDGIFDLDVTADRLWVSDTYAESLGYSAGELRARTREDLLTTVHDDDRQTFSDFIENAIVEPTAPKSIEIRQRKKDGAEMRVVVHVRVVRNGDTRARRLVGAQSDVTEQRAARAALEMQQRVESLGLLASGVAHDFNNLLLVMRINADLLRAMPSQRASDDLEETIKRAQELTQRLLAYSGRGKAVIRELDLSALTADLVRLMRQSAPSRIAFSLELASALPPVIADAAQLQQVVMNLLKNAIDAIGEGAGRITVSTFRESVVDEPGPIVPIEPGAYIALSVADTGAGMTEDVRSRIFEPLFTTKATGHGLGLAGMLGVLRAHKGGIRVKSAPGEGTTITVLLPIVR